MKFSVELTKQATKDLDKLPKETLQKISTSLLSLEKNPFPDKKRIKKIQGTKNPLYRLRIDTATDSFRAFYTITPELIIFNLRIVSKKNADRVLKQYN